MQVWLDLADAWVQLSEHLTIAITALLVESKGKFESVTTGDHLSSIVTFLAEVLQVKVFFHEG